MKNLCIIPARGGSKRIPRKNIKDFLGKPIIAYSIELALNSNMFEEVMVSTDDRDIADVAVKYGARVPFMRSAEGANDYATLADVVEEVKLQYIESNKTFENICLLLPTAPLVTVELLRKTYDLLKDLTVDSVRPVVRFSYPIQRAFKMDTNGKVELFYPEFADSRSQDLEVAYHDAGMFYWMKWNIGFKGINRYGFEISDVQCQDIDNEEDWEMAELKYKLGL